MNKYPELEKMSSIKEKSQELGLFIEWLLHRYTLAEWNANIHAKLVDKETGNEDYWGEILMPIHVGDNKINEILAEYFGIDLDKAEAERMEILKELQNDK